MAEQRTDPFGFSTAKSGGHTARSMMFREMRILFHSLPVAVTTRDFERIIIDENILGKPTLSSRKKSLYHLKELYGLDPAKALFRSLWQLGHSDPDSLPQLCLVCAYARDPQLRQSFGLIRSMRPGEVLERAAMEQHLERSFSSRFSPAVKKSMAQNVDTTWTFGGHLEGRARKTRRFPEPRPVPAAYAMLVGYLAGLRGEALLDSAYGALVAPNRSELQSALALASAKGLLSFKQAAGIVEFNFSNLLTPAEQAILYDTH